MLVRTHNKNLKCVTKRRYLYRTGSGTNKTEPRASASRSEAIQGKAIQNNVPRLGKSLGLGRTAFGHHGLALPSALALETNRRPVATDISPRGPQSLTFKSRAGNRRFWGCKRPPASPKTHGKGLGTSPPKVSRWLRGGRGLLGPSQNKFLVV